ncbi:PaaI family thioesterase [Campylobacter sp. faydin G-140]|uniref:PaaI family thioesterase n=1 Tax=Campylobacter anatolicus TaxID=2829105 RepID=UPI001B929C70|nr:hotdog domain-containing protein [Campylobacter anatolicus]MBR8462038.1 PaaI family thioesterase [Campylobacter anatolicus]MBR8464875.1 PaaI family thioesterase [Campylobacter anatolicus]
MADENIYEDNEDSNVILPEDENPLRNEIKTSTTIKINLSGTATLLELNHAKTRFYTIADMVSDSEGLVHSGFVYSAANYAALLAINEEFCVTISSRINFFAPVKLGDIVDFDATARFEESRKREVRVVGKCKDIKIFEGIFQLVVLDEHIFFAQQKNIQREATIRRAKESEKQNK